MASNFFGLLEDVSSNDPVEIAKKRQQEAVVAKKNAEKKEAADKQAQHQKDQQTSSAAKKTVEKKPAQRGGRPQQARSGDVEASSEGFEQRDNRSKRGGRGGRGGKQHVAPRAGREFDKHSGTGRGKEVSKDGAGSRNWGKPGSEYSGEKTDKKKPFLKKPKAEEKTEVESPVDTEEKKEETTTVDAEKTAEQTPEVEEEDTSITYDKLLAEKKKNKNTKPKPRKAGEGISTDPALLKGEVVKKSDTVPEDVDLPIQGLNANPKSQQKKAAASQKKQSADTRLGLGEFFKDDKDALDQLTQAQQYRPQFTKRGGSGRGRGRGNGRGASRGGRGRGAKSAAPSFKDADFPTLK